MKKILLSLFILSTAFIYADDNVQQKKVYNSSIDDSDLYKKDACAFILDAEFLYWTAEEGSLDYALAMKTPAWSTNNTSYAQGEFQIAKYNWDPGFRINIGYFNAPKYWELRGQYTWQRITGSDSCNKPTQANLYLTGTWPHGFTTGTELSSASSKIKLGYQLADLLATRVFIPNPHLRLRLVGGITGTLTKQNWKVKYNSATYQCDLKNKWRYLGIGLRLGLTLDWFMGADFYLTGQVTAATLMGRYKNTAYQKTNEVITAGDNTSIPIRNAQYKDYRPAYETQFLVGPSYQRSFSSCRFELFAGYELTNWFNLHELNHSTGSTNPANAKETWTNRSLLALHGLTVRLTLDF